MDRLTAMETFVSVIEAGSFSGAARRLKVGQPAVSKSIAQLEERLGVRLLLRSTRGLTPTDTGKQFYERSKRAIEEADEAELVARGAGASLSGRLRVCAPVTFARLRIVPAMKLFLAAHPELTIEVVLDDRHIDLLEEGIDVALRMGVLLDSGMTARKIGQARRLVVGTPAYFRSAGTPDVPADLIGHQAIVYGQSGGVAAWTFKRGSSETAVAVSGRMSVTAAEGVRAAVLADIGIAIVSEWMFAPELAVGAVDAVLTDWTLPPVDLWAVFPTGRMASAKARAFVTFVEATLGFATVST
ncbi:transcriptional regulator (plasmid) [Burkholderia sp. PAMC 28687]|uniref:Transcriptional regulator, LysR family n=1 Tax=Caballeronia sordidicola TaxID=196367 RepID=A0A242M5C2_CABSO|nr:MULTISPECIES: LysR family transcriptional regulator [Burkholderiaceae]AME28487.1 transcriptional regulator [Burkholderia sp. PAMC 26561]AMM18609.1 transcriptional regulator [Burkholderia sp. PAMC 28687]OTP66390.1 Transcriptional regulator, LysR family [Caballeronia sordidicola]